VKKQLNEKKNKTKRKDLVFIIYKPPPLVIFPLSSLSPFLSWLPFHFFIKFKDIQTTSSNKNKSLHHQFQTHGWLILGCNRRKKRGGTITLPCFVINNSSKRKGVPSPIFFIIKSMNQRQKERENLWEECPWPSSFELCDPPFQTC